jgi:hypothetical protein
MRKLLIVAAATLLIAASIAPVEAQTANRGQAAQATRSMSASDCTDTGTMAMAVQSTPVIFEADKASSRTSSGRAEAPASGNDLNWLQGGGG